MTILGLYWICKIVSTFEIQSMLFNISTPTAKKLHDSEKKELLTHLNCRTNYLSSNKPEQCQQNDKESTL